MSNFYDNLVSGKYNTYEKVASAEEDVIKDTLSELTQDQIDALVSELDVQTKKASTMSLEDSLQYEFEVVEDEIEQTASEEEVDEETEEEMEVEASEEDEVETEETEEVEDQVVEEEPSELEQELGMEVEAEEKDDDKDDKKEDKKEKSDDDDDDDDDEEHNQETNFNPAKVKGKEKCAEEEDIDFEKLSSEEQYEIIKQACEQVESDLAEAGYSVADYIYSLTGLEKHANEIAEYVEKIATVSEQPVILVANDVVNAMNEIIDAE